MIKTIIFSLFFFLAFAPLVSAATNVEVSNNSENSQSHVSVNSNTGSNTTCVNGKCTTTTGESKSTVCVNGDCYTSEEGDINVQSQNGKTTVTIDKTDQMSSPSSQPTPKIFHKKIMEKKKEFKEKMQEKKQDWMELVGSHTFNIIKKLFLFSSI